MEKQVFTDELAAEALRGGDRTGIRVTLDGSASRAAAWVLRGPRCWRLMAQPGVAVAWCSWGYRSPSTESWRLIAWR